MTKPSQNNNVASLPKWKTKWPRKGDLRSWMLCMIEKCDAIEDPLDSGLAATPPIRTLAGLGCVEESLKYVNRFLRKQPKDNSFGTSVLSRLGAQICLDSGDRERMETYLHIAATAPVRRKCDLGWPEKSVRDFRAHNGILNPADAVGDEQRIEATFERGKRQFNEAWANGQTTQAKSAIAEMERAAKELTDDLDDFMRRYYCYQTLIESYAKLGEGVAIKRCAKSLGGAAEEILEKAAEILDYRTLWKIGLKEKAVDRATCEVDDRLQELATMDDPNIHFPINAICAALEFLFEHNKRKLARVWLKKVLSEMGTWPVYEIGWTTAAVYGMLAGIVGKVEGPEAAEELMANARRDANAERRPGWRKGAVAEALTVEADLGRLEDAIARARKIRSRPERRIQVATLLARANRLKELAEVCSEVATPKEAADLCERIKFSLFGPGV